MDESIATYLNTSTLSRKQPRKVLIVEDDLFLAAIVGRAVYDVNADFDIDWATSLEQALTKMIKGIEQIGQSPYELVIADIMLEGNGTGLDLWKVFCQTYPRVPVMVMSSLPAHQVYEAVGDSHESINYIKKPFSMNELKTNIKSVFA